MRAIISTLSTNRDQVFRGTGSPVGVVTASGAAIYLDNTNPAAPVLWQKSTAGTSSADWVRLTDAIGYPEISALALRSPSSHPAIFGTTPTSRATSRLVVGSVIDENPGAGPLSFWCRFRVPTSLATNAGICALSPNETAVLGGSGSDGIGLGIISGDVNLFMGNSSTYTRYALGIAALAGQVVDVVVTRSGSTLAAYVNGVAVTLTAVAVNGGTAANATLTATWAHALAPLSATIANSNNAIAGPIHRFAAFNYALTASGAASLSVNGVSASDQWGAKDPVMSATVANGGFETAGAGGADAFASWDEIANGASTINRDTVVFASGTASCRMDLDAIGSSTTINSQLVNIAIGRRYRFECLARGTGTSPALSINTHNQFYQPLGPILNNTAWQACSLEFVGGDPALGSIGGNPFISIGRRAGAQNGSIWIDDVTVTRIGAFLDLQFDGTCGNQAADRANQRDAVLFSGAGFTLPEANRGFARWVASTPGGERMGGSSGTVIPLDASISRILVRNLNLGAGQTFNLGPTSGSTTNVNAAPLGGTGSVTVIDPTVSTSSTGQLWVSYTGTGSIEVTVYFERF